MALGIEPKPAPDPRTSRSLITGPFGNIYDLG